MVHQLHEPSQSATARARSRPISPSTNSTNSKLSITIPLVLFGLYRYWYLVEARDGGESPTDVILTDWPMGIVVLLWIGACVVTYFVNDSFAPHALQGLSLPFAVLAVRAWRRLRLPAVLGVAGVALITIPGGRK